MPNRVPGRLERVRASEQVVLDYSRLILEEYHKKLKPDTRSGAGSAFLKWLLQTQARSVSWVTITATDDQNLTFAEFPPDADLHSDFDPDDRKFVAASNAHPQRPPIVQSADSKWLAWEARLANNGIRLDVLCRPELEAIRDRRIS